MLDTRLRGPKDRLLAPLAGRIGAHVPAIAVSLLALAAALTSAVTAAAGLVALSVAAWLVSRLLDGLDGPVARARGAASDVGGLLDLLFDAVGYATVPLGVAVAVDERATWIAVACLLAAFYVNAISLLHASAVLERRRAERRVERTAALRASRSTATTTELPRGVVEGTETIVLFALFLASPQHATTIFVVMAIGVVLTVVERTGWIVRTLR